MEAGRWKKSKRLLLEDKGCPLASLVYKNAWFTSAEIYALLDD